MFPKSMNGLRCRDMSVKQEPYDIQLSMIDRCLHTSQASNQESKKNV